MASYGGQSVDLARTRDPECSDVELSLILLRAQAFECRAVQFAVAFARFQRSTLPSLAAALAHAGAVAQAQADAVRAAHLCLFPPSL